MPSLSGSYGGCGGSEISVAVGVFIVESGIGIAAALSVGAGGGPGGGLGASSSSMVVFVGVCIVLSVVGDKPSVLLSPSAGIHGIEEISMSGMSMFGRSSACSSSGV